MSRSSRCTSSRVSSGLAARKGRVQRVVTGARDRERQRHAEQREHELESVGHEETVLAVHEQDGAQHVEGQSECCEGNDQSRYRKQPSATLGHFARGSTNDWLFLSFFRHALDGRRAFVTLPPEFVQSLGLSQFSENARCSFLMLL